MTRGAQTKVRPYNFFIIKIIYTAKQPYYTVQEKSYAAVHQFAHLWSQPSGFNRPSVTDRFKREGFNPRPEIKTR